MPWNDGLTGPAYEVAASEATRLRVRAGPGTGKTFALMRRVARLLEEGVTGRRVLVSTFTRMAASDLKEAVVQLNVPGAGLVRATTIHAYCFGVLKRHDVLEITGRVPRPVLDFECRFLVEDLCGGTYGDVHERRRRLKAFEAAWARLQDDHPGWPRNAVDQAFQAELLDWLRFHRAMLIGELVPEALRYLRNNPAARELGHFIHILVDEYQDLNVAEQSIIDLLAGCGALTIVGDEDQSIYSFKYAHPDGIEDFHLRHSESEDKTLSTCRRCPTAIVMMANQLIANNTRRASRALIPREENGEGEVHIVQWRNIEAEADGLARFVRDRVATAQVQPGQILVLAPGRVFGYAIRDALNRLDVQAHSFFQEQALEGDPKQIEASRTQQAMTLLALLVDRVDSVALRCWCGFGSQSLRRPAWARVRQLCEESGDAISVVLEEIRNNRRSLPYGGSLRARLEELSRDLEECGALAGQDLIDRLFPADDDAFQTLRELASGVPANADAETLLDTLRTSITQPVLPTDVDYVRVMSLHKSKGLTADLVIVMGCVEGLVPRVDYGGAGQDMVLEEQRRLFYVALTRTRQTLVLSSVTNLPADVAHRLRARSRTITSRFIHELGPARPAAILGTELS